ncbi:ECF transporter S component, folate family [Lachnospiraceae bacterium KH1T2]|nr:ECF transporter S component, folate family [Lachnospiraceae bacterium KH1T2]
MSKLRNTKTITTAGMLVAIGIVLGFFKVPINNLIEIRFGNLPIAAAGTLMGPVPAAIVGALTDIGGFLVKPTGAFFPGFTLSGIITGIIFGLLLKTDDSSNLSIVRIFIAQLIVTVFVNVLLNGYWLSLLYGKGYAAILIARIPKELIMLPINTLLITAIAKPVRMIGRAAFNN